VDAVELHGSLRREVVAYATISAWLQQSEAHLAVLNLGV
jgi:hypothetical protein